MNITITCAINEKLIELRKDLAFEKGMGMCAASIYGRELAGDVFQKEFEIEEQIRILQNVLNEGHDLRLEIQRLKSGIADLNKKRAELYDVKLKMEKELNTLQSVLKLFPELNTVARPNDNRSSN